MQKVCYVQGCNDIPKYQKCLIFFVIFGVRFLCHLPRFGTVLVSNTYNSHLFESNTPGMEENTQKKNQKWRHQIVSVMNIISFNNIRLKDPSANYMYRYHAWKYFGFKIVNINGTETRGKDKTVSKICVNDASYKIGNISNMSTHFRRKHGII